MPYAANDRLEFIKRSDLKPESRVLDLGGMLLEELTDAFSAITSKRAVHNAIIIRPQLLPFKNSKFGAVVSYHYIDLVPSDKLEYAFAEVARVLEKEASFSFMVQHWSARNEAQKSNLFFNEVLKCAGVLCQHDFEEISIKLNASGFSEITFESIKREIQVPAEFISEHIMILGNLVKMEKAQGGAAIKALAKQYLHQVKEHGEEMLPAIHFIAKK